MAGIKPERRRGPALHDDFGARCSGWCCPRNANFGKHRDRHIPGSVIHTAGRCDIHRTLGRKKAISWCSLIDAMLNNRPLPYDLKKTAPRVIAVSLATGAVIYLLETTVFSSVSAQLAIQSPEIELWKGLLASFYGGFSGGDSAKAFPAFRDSVGHPFVATPCPQRGKVQVALPTECFGQRTF